MRHTTLSIPALVCLGFAGCGRSAPDRVPPPQRVAVDSAVPTEDTAAVLLGDWELRSDPPLRPPGFSITVTVDSVTDARYFGRLTHYFSGNVGRDPGDFEAFRDSVRSDGAVRLSIPTADPAMLGIVMEGSLTADTISLSLFVLGPDTLSSGTRRWSLVKRP